MGSEKGGEKVKVTDFPFRDLNTKSCHAFSEETQLFPAPSQLVFQLDVTTGVGGQVGEWEG
jgi:hypothetical protein